MENQFSLDEVNNFIAKLKKKRGPKTSTSQNEQPKKSVIQEKTNTVDNLFNVETNVKDNSEKLKEDESTSVFSNNTNKDENKNNLNNFENTFNSKTNLDNVFDNNKKEDDFNDFLSKNTENIFEPKNIQKKENKLENKIENKLENKIENDFTKNKNNDTGMVLNNPLVDEQNNDNNNIFGQETNNEDVNDIFNNNYNDNNLNQDYSNNNQKEEQIEDIFNANNKQFPPKIKNFNQKKNYKTPFSDNYSKKIPEQTNINEFTNNNNLNYENNNNNFYNNEAEEKLDDDNNNDNNNNYTSEQFQTNIFNNNNVTNNNNSYQKTKNIPLHNETQSSDNNLTSIINQKIDYSNETYGFSGIDQDYIIYSTNDGSEINIYNIFTTLNSYSENQLYENYFPVSYSKASDLQKASNLLSLVLNNGSELYEPLSHIAIHLIKYVLENQFNVNKINFLQNNSMCSKIIEILYNSLRNQNKGLISLSDLFNIENISTFEKNNNNLLNCDFLNDNNIHPLNYILNVFNEGYMNKNNILYIYLLLLNIKDNDNNKNIEDCDIILENFDCALYILLKYFNNNEKVKEICQILLKSYSPKLNFCHYIILSCLSRNYEIDDEKYYGKIFSSYLQFSSIEKVLIADMFNFILFSVSTNLKKIIAKSSILIKYKYLLLRQNYKKDTNVIELGKKIYENITQFGEIHKNIYFNQYLKDNFYDIGNNITFTSLNKAINNNNNYNNNKNIFNNNQHSHNNNENIFDNNNSNNQETNIFDYDDNDYKNKNIINDHNSNNSINDNHNLNSNKNNTNNNKNESNGGYFSSFISAFGFGGKSNNEQNSNNNNNNTLSEEEKQKLSPDELWKLEHPGEPEIVYDPKLKRYILRGKIYDDQEEVIQKKEKERPMIPPPKFKKPVNNNQNNFNENKEEENNLFDVGTNSNNYGGGNMKINNPFASNQIKKPPKPPTVGKRPGMNNLTKRYAVGYNK